MYNTPLIIVSGANGQLGRSIRTLSEEYPDIKFLFADIEDMDITKADSLYNFLRTKGYDSIGADMDTPFILINCAAYTNVEQAEDDIMTTDLINHKGAVSLARTCKELGGLMIQISTDYVFDGKHSEPYTEDDIAVPLSIYGRSKYSADEEILNILDNRAIIVRTSWLYSDYGNNFLFKILRLAEERDKINVVFDQIGTPTYAPHLALALICIAMDAFSHNKFPFTVVNYTDAGVCSWYDLAYYAVSHRGGDDDCMVLPIASSDYPTKAVRPSFSVLSKKRFDNYYHIRRYHWTVGVDKFISKL